ILTAAVGSYSAISGQRAKRQPVLDARVISRLVLTVADVLSPLHPAFETASLDEHGRDRNHQRARAAHARCPRKVAREDKVGSQRCAWEVSRESAHDHRN